VSNKLPSVTSDIPRDLRTFIDRLREIISGTGTNRLVSVQDLITGGIAGPGSNGTITPPTTANIGTPPAPQNVTATGAIYNVLIEWDSPTYFGHDYSEIYGGSTNVIGDAVQLAFVPGVNYADPIGPSQSRYYWVRFVNTLGDLGFSNSSSSTSFDAFGRLRMSEPYTLFDSSHRYADNGLWATASGVSGYAQFNQSQGLIDLNVVSGSGSYVTRETKRVFAYQPGKSILNLNTFVMSPAKTGLRQRIGYFGDDNGMFLQLNGSTLSFVKRSSITGSIADTAVNQADWNGDKLDGTGASGITLDITKAQILWMDLEWLGVGSVRMGFVINGKFILCHTFNHANLIDSTYITTASLPLRYEINNTAATSGNSTLKQICSTVLSEGGYELKGGQQALGFNVGTPYNHIITTNTDYPVTTIRLKSTRLDAVVVLSALSVLAVSTADYRWKLVMGGTTTGGSGTWVSAGTDSAVEYKQDATGISGGRVLASAYISSTNQSNPSINLSKGDLFKFQLERDGITDTPYELTLVVSASAANAGSPAKVLASLDWEEISR